MRDNIWLKNILEEVWDKHFNDVPKLNNIEIFFSRKSKKRLASIRQKHFNDKKSDTEIRVTGYYINEEVPFYVVRTTIAHELCHYTHGFASPLPQFSKFPHKGDIVDKELIKRGLGEDLTKQEDWLKENWKKIVKKSAPVKRKKRVKTRSFSKEILKFLTNFGYING